MSPTATASPPLAEIASQLADACKQLKAWEERRAALLAHLEALHEAGQAPEKFRHAGISYTRVAGRTIYDYSGAPVVIRAKAELKTAEEEAKALGLAIRKSSTASWRVSTPRS
jgi:hypothetical protein